MRPSTPAEDEQQANGWGLHCPRDNHRDGYPVAAGWEQVAMRHLLGGHRADRKPTMWRPFDPVAPLGPPPPCYGRFLRAWYGHTLGHR
ncbi:MAG: hypothetical protein H0V23_11940 [Nocardioidaceae bacterium]|nr:hypothetical protein [Nocardioidaceae bacterium]